MPSTGRYISADDGVRVTHPRTVYEISLVPALPTMDAALPRFRDTVRWFEGSVRI